MKSARAWGKDLATAKNDAVQLVDGRDGQSTLRVGSLYLHSRYAPDQEAQRLIESAALDTSRPVFVIGLGLGYHVKALLDQGMTVAVAEPDPAVARLALEGPMKDVDFLLGVGDVDAMAATPGFLDFAARMPQVLAHPATARLHPGYVEAVSAALSKRALAGQRLSVAIVGPLYGGSLPITGYLADAFRKLGHQTLLVDNSMAYDLYRTVAAGVENARANSQLTQILTNFLAEWTYARVAEFNPEICIVMAQSPVGPNFPGRLAEQNITTAFWYVENWRHLPYWKEIAPYYDYFFHIQPGEFDQKLDEIGCRHHAFVQTACDPHLHRPVTLAAAERSTFDCDLSFAGAGYYNRLQFFKGLTDYRFKIWGVDWREKDLAKLLVGGEQRFDSETFMKIVAGSKINLNLHSSTSHDGVDSKCDAINPRVFEIAAAGGFQVCDPCIGLETHFDFETELPVYRDLKSLRGLIDHFLAHPEERLAIAKQARERVLREHTYEHRAKQMLDLIFEHHGTKMLRRGVRIQRTVEEMAHRVGAGSELGSWLATLPKETMFLPDALAPFLSPGAPKAVYPEKVLAYMREVCEFAEALLKAPR